MILRSGLLVFTCMGHPLAAKEALIVALSLQHATAAICLHASLQNMPITLQAWS